jgi:hypothetical protein
MLQGMRFYIHTDYVAGIEVISNERAGDGITVLLK